MPRFIAYLFYTLTAILLLIALSVMPDTDIFTNALALRGLKSPNSISIILSFITLSALCMVLITICLKIKTITYQLTQIHFNKKMLILPTLIIALYCSSLDVSILSDYSIYIICFYISFLKNDKL